MDKQIGREIYLDVCKGIAMLLVVMQHVGAGLDAGVAFICRVDVPLFFRVSGFLAYRVTIDLRNSCIKKLVHIGIPFLAATLFAALWYGLRPLDVLFDIGKCGYWFLESLLMMQLLFYAIYSIDKYAGYKYITLSGGVEVMLLLLSKFGPESLDNIMGISYMARYFPCFTAGILLRRHRFADLHRGIGTLLVFVTCVGFTYNGADKNLNFILNVLAYLSSSVVFFYFIKALQVRLPAMAVKYLACVGRHTLGIYIIHFYFVFQLPQTSEYFVVNFMSTFAVACAVVMLSLVTSLLLSKSTLLNFLLSR